MIEIGPNLMGVLITLIVYDMIVLVDKYFF